MSISWLHFQSCLDPLSFTNNMPVSLSICHSVSIMCGKWLYGTSYIITFSFPNDYVQLMTPSKSSQSNFHCSLPNPYQNSSSFPWLKPPSHYTALTVQILLFMISTILKLPPFKFPALVYFLKIMLQNSPDIAFGFCSEFIWRLDSGVWSVTEDLRCQNSNK